MVTLGDKSALERIAANAEANVQRHIEQGNKGNSKQQQYDKSLDPIRDALTRLASVGANVLNSIETVASSNPPASVMTHIMHLVSTTSKHWGTVLDMEHIALSPALERIGAPFVESFLDASLGINLDDADTKNLKAIATIKRVAGFCILFPFATASITAVGKMLFRECFPESLAETIGGLSEDLGLNWLTGNLFETIFEQAVGRPLEEVINKQVHPNRFDMQTLRALARQHKIKRKDFKGRLDEQGYLPDDIDSLLQMDTQQLPMAELQQAYQNGALKGKEVHDYLYSQGFSDQDISILLNNYIKHGETEAVTLYKGAARAAFRAGHITEAQYTAILTKLDVPAASIKLDIQAIKLEIETGKKHVSFAILKDLYRRKIIHWEVVALHLSQDQYAQADIDDIHKLWDADPIASIKHLPAAKVLQYYVTGALTDQQTKAHLLSNGYSADDTDFLIAHPSTKGATKALGLGKGTILSALKNKLISEDDARAKLLALKIEPAEVDLAIRIAMHEQLPHLPPEWPSKTLSEKDIKSAVQLGLRDTYWAWQQYESYGYSTDDAILLAVIDSSGTGPYTPPGPGDSLHPIPGVSYQPVINVPDNNPVPINPIPEPHPLPPGIHFLYDQLLKNLPRDIRQGFLGASQIRHPSGYSHRHNHAPS